MARANQPLNYDEDISEVSVSGDESDSKIHVIYLTTSMLSPKKQALNEISVETLNED